MEDGPLSELEKSVAERTHLLAQSGRLLDKLVADLSAARLELERRDATAAASQDEQRALQERIKEVTETRGQGSVCLTAYQIKAYQGEVHRTSDNLHVRRFRHARKRVSSRTYALLVSFRISGPACRKDRAVRV